MSDLIERLRLNQGVILKANAKSEGAEGGFIAEGSLSTDGLCPTIFGE